MNKFFLLFLFICLNFLLAQKKPHYLINIDYTSQNSNNTIGLGPEVFFVHNNKQITALNVNLIYDVSNTKFFPEISVNQHFNINFLNPYSSNIKSNFLNMGGSISTEYIRPEFGINFLDIITVKSGYNFIFNNQSVYKGFNIGVNLHLPIITIKEIVLKK